MNGTEVPIDNLVSINQAAVLLGVPAWVLRRCLNDGMETLPVSRTAGAHQRVPVKALIDDYEKIIDEIHQWRINTSRRADSKTLPRKSSAEKIAELRKVMRETIDANTAATMLGVSRPTLRRWEREGKIIGVRPLGPKQVRYYRESVAALMEAGTI
ncbi:helix-turn-helix DNA binding domain protein [Gordonia phage Commandaria]|uniref:Helix-turn-helix DNA binding domain protein n=1 Tax=Gordonia phage Commandaria TaxID=3038364 RepID=A0AAF0GGS3_9CAUD|nr:helix-turn-helix DNA binding domain protein [Gordonia phage Commandaria]WGH20840.1 helix-turn-helix DNA binding domain protein [Gordonia phage Commandaria]